MAPAIPIGALAIVDERARDKIVVGDVITLRTSNGTLMTHRVTRIADIPSGLAYETMGDANQGPDPVLVPAAAVVGVVHVIVPVAGLILAMLSVPVGIVSLLSTMATFRTASLLLQEIDRARPPRTANSPSGAGS